jgi:hypothetical protein
MKVRDPQGQSWRVTRRWVPWRRRLRGIDGVPDLPVALGDDPISALLAVLALVLLVPFVVLAVVAALELLLVLLVLPFAVLGRVLLGRHWHVEVRRGFRPWWEVEAGDWAASRLRIQELASELEQGRIPDRTLGT